MYPGWLAVVHMDDSGSIAVILESKFGAGVRRIGGIKSSMQKVNNGITLCRYCFQICPGSCVVDEQGEEAIAVVDVGPGFVPQVSEEVVVMGPRCLKMADAPWEVSESSADSEQLSQLITLTWKYHMKQGTGGMVGEPFLSFSSVVCRQPVQVQGTSGEVMLKIESAEYYNLVQRMSMMNRIRGILDVDSMQQILKKKSQSTVVAAVAGNLEGKEKINDDEYEAHNDGIEISQRDIAISGGITSN